MALNKHVLLSLPRHVFCAILLRPYCHGLVNPRHPSCSAIKSTAVDQQHPVISSCLALLSNITRRHSPPATWAYLTGMISRGEL
uniref:Putative secreted protein n=1 Tax=Anopheles darlingi TaxID=43151 RepID=A0A2M4DCW0_ANODA